MSQEETLQELAGFRLVKTLGKGGMGAVYKAIHPRTGAEVAIKVILQGLQGREEVQERFRREVRAMAMVEHPNLVRILEAGESDGHSYYVMQLVDGVDLATYIHRKGALKPALVEQIARGLFSALGALHDQGILHRDLKPHNVMLDRAGQPLIMDLGLTRLSDMQTMTRTGALIGSPRYMPPELLEGRPLDPRADLYQVGLILWECLTGATAVSGESFQEVSAKILTGQIPDLAEVRPECPTHLREIVHLCIATEPEDRIQTGHQALDVLDGRLAMEELRRELSESAAQRLEQTFENPQVAALRSGSKDAVLAPTQPSVPQDPGPAPSRFSVVWTRVVPGLLFVLCLLGGYHLAQPPPLERPQDFVAMAGVGRIKASWTGARGTRLQLVVTDSRGRSWRVPEGGPRAIEALPGGRSELVLEGVPPGSTLEAFLEFGKNRTLVRSLETPPALLREGLRLIGVPGRGAIPEVALRVEAHLDCAVEVKYPRTGGGVEQATAAPARSHLVLLAGADLGRSDASLRIRLTDPTGAVESAEPPIVSLLSEAGLVLARKLAALEVPELCRSLAASEEDPEAARRLLAQVNLDGLAQEFRPLVGPFLAAREVDRDLRRRVVEAIEDMRQLEHGFLSLGAKPAASPTDLLQASYARSQEGEGWRDLLRASLKQDSLLPPGTPDRLMIGADLTRDYRFELPRLPKRFERLRIGFLVRVQSGRHPNYLRVAVPGSPVLKVFLEDPVGKKGGNLVFTREIDERDVSRKGGEVSVTLQGVLRVPFKSARIVEHWVELQGE